MAITTTRGKWKASVDNLEACNISTVLPRYFHGTSSVLLRFADVIDAIVETLPAEAYLHLMELTTEHTLKPAYDVGNEFEIGFNLF